MGLGEKSSGPRLHQLWTETSTNKRPYAPIGKCHLSTVDRLHPPIGKCHMGTAELLKRTDTQTQITQNFLDSVQNLNF